MLQTDVVEDQTENTRLPINYSFYFRTCSFFLWNECCETFWLENL